MSSNFVMQNCYQSNNTGPHTGITWYHTPVSNIRNELQPVPFMFFSCFVFFYFFFGLKAMQLHRIPVNISKTCSFILHSIDIKVYCCTFYFTNLHFTMSQHTTLYSRNFQEAIKSSNVRISY